MNEKSATRLRGEQEGWNKRRVNARELAERSGQAGYLTVRRGLTSCVSRVGMRREREKERQRNRGRDGSGRVFLK